MREIKEFGTSTLRWILTLAGVSLVAGLTPALVEAQNGRSRQGRASVTRSDRNQPGQQSRASSQRTTVNRGSSAGRSRSEGTRRHGSRHRGSRHHGSRYGRSHRSSLYLGYGGYYGYGWPFYNPYYYGSYGYRYGYGYPYEWGHRYRRSYSEALGAFDLDVKPKKTEVYLNGHFIGTASKYDGYPSLLWVPEGEHQLVFFKPGFATEVREVEALPGVRLELELDMRPGESTPVKDVAVEAKTAPVAERRPYVGGRTARSTPPTADREAAGAVGDSAVLDTRGEPGRLLLRVAPEDAAVYLDGRFLGTGGEIAALHAGLLVDAGEHVLNVVQPGRETSVDFSVDPGQERELTVDLDEL